MMSFTDTLYVFQIVGVTVFAMSGALAGAERKLDILGFILFGTLTGVGGGTLRDILLNTDQVFWMDDSIYLWACVFGAVATWYFAPKLYWRYKALLWADAMGLALFSVLGAQKALDWDAPAIAAVGMGMITASFGSILRDIFLGRDVVMLGPEIYVSAAGLGAVTFISLNHFYITQAFALPVGVLAAFALRGGAILKDWRLPKYGD